MAYRLPKKVEGAEKIAKKKEREAKKKDEELTKRLLHAAGEKKKAYKKAEDDKKAAKHKAKSWVRQYKVKKVWKKVKPFRAPIAITLAVIIVVGSSYGIITGIIIPNRIARENAEREAANAKLVEDNRTDMIRLFSKLAGKELKEDEVDTLVKEMHNDIRTTLYREDEEGFIEHEGGKSEFIRFSLIEKDSLTFATRFYYISSLDGKAVKIYGGENGYYYVNGNDFRESSNLNELIEDYILAMVKGQE